MARLLQRVLDVWICEESKMAHSNLRLTDATFSSQLIQTSGGLRSRLVVLTDSKNVGIAVGISFLSCILAEIYVVSCLLPV